MGNTFYLHRLRIARNLCWTFFLTALQAQQQNFAFGKSEEQFPEYTMI